ncbi:hypothetical protein swp_3084 [Shewanella piezotolerans WP3]|uniref:Uncharacterized protein n=1 Tax=Shewanella piezotolerans (strain WP3 / JCM 13877) TaxID=225849 RepID=B8CPT6_SHEPW|nr:hypothetical protein swp_3084 [Shewanella piezotolerans WP3]
MLAALLFSCFIAFFNKNHQWQSRILRSRFD